VAIADKIDTMVGIFDIGQPPTGSKDPFALRRAALGIVRIIIETELDLDLKTVLGQAERCYQGLGSKQRVLQPETLERVFAFMMERLRVYYTDAGISVDVFEAVSVIQPSRPYDFDQRVRAVNAFRQLAGAEALAAANKRAVNILRQAIEGGVTVAAVVDSSLLQEAAEQALAERIASVSEAVKPALEKLDYTSALQEMAALRETVDAFFDEVMVMVEDEQIKLNRLALLNSLHHLFMQVADVSQLQS